ncbi:MAG: YchJ family protein [Cyanobacteria bacterium P01_E01_bin.45]
MEFSKTCPCGTQKPYRECCGPFHRGDRVAPTAEALMRSRYSAFATGNVEYLMATHHPSKRALDERARLAQTCQDTSWLWLDVVDTHNGTAGDTEGVVEFIAKFSSGSQLGMLHERSRFVKEGDRWFYLDGVQNDGKLRGRNDPCWCQSGKKYKKCHGRK